MDIKSSRTRTFFTIYGQKFLFYVVFCDTITVQNYTFLDYEVKLWLFVITNFGNYLLTAK